MSATTRFVRSVVKLSEHIQQTEAASDLLHYIWDTERTNAFDYDRVAEGMALLFGPKSGEAGRAGWRVDDLVERIKLVTKPAD